MVLKADVIIFLSSGDGADAGSSRCAQANLNDWGTGGEQDLYQSCFAWRKTFNLLICLTISTICMSAVLKRASGFPTVCRFTVRITEKDCS
jgi:hypothetical protein